MVARRTGAALVVRAVINRELIFFKPSGTKSCLKRSDGWLIGVMQRTI